MRHNEEIVNIFEAGPHLIVYLDSKQHFYVPSGYEYTTVYKMLQDYNNGDRILNLEETR